MNRGWIAPALALSLATPAAAVEFDLMSVGVRARLGEKRVLGEEQPESFRAYDVVGTFRLPALESTDGGWARALRVQASAGLLHGADDNALVLSAIPVVAIGTSDWRYTLDFGLGLALLSRHEFAQQDMGGPIQAALTLGLSARVYEQVSVGYRFMHYSDAGAWGKHTIGADFHMIEFGWRF